MAEKDSRPEDHLKRLQRIAEEIPSGVSADDMKSILRVRQSHELHGVFSNLITSTVNKALERVWADFNISEKLSHLQELEEASPKEDAWRPTTGKADVNHIIADCLMKEKEELMRLRKLVREETDMVKLYLNNFHDKTEKQLEEINISLDPYRENNTNFFNKQIM